MTVGTPSTTMHNYLDIILQNRINTLNNQALEFTKKFDSRIYELQHELHKFSQEKMHYHQALAANHKKVQERVTRLPNIVTENSANFRKVGDCGRDHSDYKFSNILAASQISTRQRRQMLNNTNRELRRLRRASIKYPVSSAEELANQRRRKLNLYHSNCNADRSDAMLTTHILPSGNRTEVVALESVKTANAMLRTPFMKQRKQKRAV